MYSKRDVESANKARDLIVEMGYPSTKDVVQIVKRGTILDCSVTIQDVYRAIRIYGPALGSLRAKTKRSKPEFVVMDPIGKISKL